jgi:hypothetical protein
MSARMWSVCVAGMFLAAPVAFGTIIFVPDSYAYHDGLGAAVASSSQSGSYGEGDGIDWGWGAAGGSQYRYTTVGHNCEWHYHLRAFARAELSVNQIPPTADFAEADVYAAVSGPTTDGYSGYTWVDYGMWPGDPPDPNYIVDAYGEYETNSSYVIEWFDANEGIYTEHEANAYAGVCLDSEDWAMSHACVLAYCTFTEAP